MPLKHTTKTTTNKQKLTQDNKSDSGETLTWQNSSGSDKNQNVRRISLRCAYCEGENIFLRLGCFIQLVFFSASTVFCVLCNHSPQDDNLTH